MNYTGSYNNKKPGYFKTLPEHVVSSPTGIVKISNSPFPSIDPTKRFKSVYERAGFDVYKPPNGSSRSSRSSSSKNVQGLRSQSTSQLDSKPFIPFQSQRNMSDQFHTSKKSPATPIHANAPDIKHAGPGLSIDAKLANAQVRSYQTGATPTTSSTNGSHRFVPSGKTSRTTPRQDAIFNSNTASQSSISIAEEDYKSVASHPNSGNNQSIRSHQSSSQSSHFVKTPITTTANNSYNNSHPSQTNEFNSHSQQNSLGEYVPEHPTLLEEDEGNASADTVKYSGSDQPQMNSVSDPNTSTANQYYNGFNNSSYDEEYEKGPGNDALAYNASHFNAQSSFDHELNGSTPFNDHNVSAEYLQNRPIEYAANASYENVYDNTPAPPRALRSNFLEPSPEQQAGAQSNGELDYSDNESFRSEVLSIAHENSEKEPESFSFEDDSQNTSLSVPALSRDIRVPDLKVTEAYEVEEEIGGDNKNNLQMNDFMKPRQIRPIVSMAASSIYTPSNSTENTPKPTDRYSDNFEHIIPEDSIGKSLEDRAPYREPETNTLDDASETDPDTTFDDDNYDDAHEDVTEPMYREIENQLDTLTFHSTVKPEPLTQPAPSSPHIMMYSLKEVSTEAVEDRNPEDKASTHDDDDDDDFNEAGDSGEVEPLKINKSFSKKYPPGEGPCRKCGLDIERKPIYSTSGELSGQWHRECFTCTLCDIKFNKNISCFVLKDQPYCEYHYHVQNNSLCKICGKGIVGKCLENDDHHRYHINCLKCIKCGDSITNDYLSIDGDVHCEKCAKQFASGVSNTSIQRRRTRLYFI